VPGVCTYTLSGSWSETISGSTDNYVLSGSGSVAPLSLVKISGNCTNGIVLSNIRGAKLINLHVTGYHGALLTLTNVQGIGLQEPNK